MPIAIPCPHCDKLLRLPDHLYDQPGQCPLCAGALRVRWRRLKQPVRSSEVETDRRPCRFCRQPIRAEALKCPFCRRWLNTER